MDSGRYLGSAPLKTFVLQLGLLQQADRTQLGASHCGPFPWIWSDPVVHDDVLDEESKYIFLRGDLLVIGIGG